MDQWFFRIIVGKVVFTHYVIFWMLADKLIVASFDFSRIADVQVFGTCFIGLQVRFRFHPVDICSSRHAQLSISVGSAPCFVCC